MAGPRIASCAPQAAGCWDIGLRLPRWAPRDESESESRCGTPRRKGYRTACEICWGRGWAGHARADHGPCFRLLGGERVGGEEVNGRFFPGGRSVVLVDVSSLVPYAGQAATPCCIIILTITIITITFKCWNAVSTVRTFGPHGLIMGRFLKFGVTDDFFCPGPNHHLGPSWTLLLASTHKHSQFSGRNILDRHGRAPSSISTLAAVSSLKIVFLFHRRQSENRSCDAIEGSGTMSHSDPWFQAKGTGNLVIQAVTSSFFH